MSIGSIISAIAALLCTLGAFMYLILSPTIVFNANPDIIFVGESSTLAWNVTDKASVSIEPDIGCVGVSGTRTVCPNTTTTYTLKAHAQIWRSSEATVKVIVKEAPIDIEDEPENTTGNTCRENKSEVSFEEQPFDIVDKSENNTEYITSPEDKNEISVEVPSKFNKDEYENITVNITSPKDGGEVPIFVEVNGTILGELPDGKYMWLVVNPHELPGQWRPQEHRIDPFREEWHTKAQIGKGARDIRNDFDIAVILVNEVDDRLIRDWVTREKNTDSWSYIDLDEYPSKEFKERITVTLGPEVKITSHKTGDNVLVYPNQIEVNGTISSELPKGVHMWLVVNPCELRGQWWPQEGPVVLEEKAWHRDGVLFGGGVGDIDKAFNIAIILVDEEDNKKLENWILEGRKNDDWPSIDLNNYSSVNKIQTIKVTAKEPDTQIVLPENGSEVTTSIEVHGIISGKLPDGLYMWLVVNPHKLPGQWWPQGQPQIEPDGGQWYSEALIGDEKGDIGNDFEIAIIFVNEEDNQSLMNWVAKGQETGKWPSIPMPDKAIIGSTITVKRT